MLPDLYMLPPAVINRQAAEAIVRCNETTELYGLRLSPAEALQLAERRAEELARYGRIEFGGGIIERLIMTFCDSPFMNQQQYPSLLGELLELFYYCKNEARDMIGDEELLLLMKHCFDHDCQGSLELLQTREMEEIAFQLRRGMKSRIELEGYEIGAYYQYFDREEREP